MKPAQQEISKSSTSTISKSSFEPPKWLGPLGLSRFVAIDIETTGLLPNSDAIIEIGAVRFEGGVVSDIFQSFVNPRRPLPPAITVLTGIHERDITDAPLFDDVSQAFLNFIDDNPIVGQNPSFDIAFLTASGGTEFRFPGRTIIDTGELARIFWAEFPRFSLTNLCSFFDVSLESAHRASDDARATGEVLVRIISRLPSRVWNSLASDIANIAAQGHHRSEEFFKSLRAVSARIEPPVLDNAHALDEIPLLSKIELSELESGGLFEKKLDQFSPRKQQIEMARQVLSAFEENHTLLLEAPTGTGKSFGYLIPALAWSLAGEGEEKRQVIVSSHTRSLQEQLLKKDIKDIAFATSTSIPASVLKGRENYLCLRRFRSAIHDIDGRLSDGDRHRLLPLLRWSYLTKSGDIGEIGAFHPEKEPLLWSLVCSDSAACSGPTCGSHRGDFYRKAVDDSRNAKVLLINHALFSTDFERFLGSTDVSRRVVIDEAHQFERAVVSASTHAFNLKSVRIVLSRLADERSSRGLLLRNAKSKLPEAVESELLSLDILTKALFQLARASFASAALLAQKFTAEESKQRLLPGTHLVAKTESALQNLIERMQELHSRLDSLLKDMSRLSDSSSEHKDRVLELRSSALALGEVIKAGELTTGCKDSDFVYWLELTGQKNSPVLSLYAAPISIGSKLADTLWLGRTGTVLTSATLALGNSFDVIEKSLGISESSSMIVQRRILSSPFAFNEQMRILCPTFLPEAKDTEQHIIGVARIISEVIARYDKSTLVLCTSYASTIELAKRLTSIARRRGRTLLQQQSGRITHELLKTFREHPGSILIGTSTLWEGIDLVGEELEILVIVKLPFEVPTDPWIQARSELVQSMKMDPFYAISVPACAIRLRQGLGRLIRHHEDRGIAIVTDSRLVSSRYGKVLQNALAADVIGMGSEESFFAEIEEFFSGKSR